MDSCGKIGMDCDQPCVDDAVELCQRIDQTCFTVNLCRHLAIKSSKKTATEQPALKSRLLNYTNTCAGGGENGGQARVSDLPDAVWTLYEAGTAGKTY